MKAYKASFIKKDGNVREITFAKIKDLPEGFLRPAIGKPKVFTEGMELVWDLEIGAYRVFNNKTIIGKIEEFETKLKQGV